MLFIIFLDHFFNALNVGVGSPFTKALAKTNAVKPRLASPSWALTYEETNAMFSELNAYLISYLTAKGYRAAVSREASTFSTEKLISNHTNTSSKNTSRNSGV